jgi:3',5'-nucleoside bisphosphate phosphatase
VNGWQELERVDLHTHSSCSDGTLAPEELAAAAAARAVQWLALTDHDTLAGCAEAAAACASRAVRFIPGVELTADWKGREVHLVGLSVDSANAGLARHCETQLQRRRQRMTAIGERLEARGLAVAGFATDINARHHAPTRMHYARALVAAGLADSAQQAFDRWLGRGQPGFVPADWPSVTDTAQCIATNYRTAGCASCVPHSRRRAAWALKSAWPGSAPVTRSAPPAWRAATTWTAPSDPTFMNPASRGARWGEWLSYPMGSGPSPPVLHDRYSGQYRSRAVPQY